MATEQFSGPVNYLVFAFDKNADLGAGLTAILDRVNEGIVEILDIEVIAKGSDGAPVKQVLANLDGVTGVDLAVFDGVESSILDAEDLADITSELRTGQIAVAVVYEDRSLAVAAREWAATGGVEMFSGGIDIADLEHALEEGN